MKKFLIGAAASAMLAPLAAHADTTGFIDVAHEHSESGANTADSWTLGGAIQHDFANGWSVQGDARITEFEGGGGSTVAANYAAAHIFTALTQHADVAAFVGLLDIGDDAWNAGVEARVRQGQWSLQGSLGYLQFPNAPGSSDAWDSRVRGWWFINADTALSPSIAYFEWHEGNFTHKHFELGVGAAHRFTNGVELYADYFHSDNDSTPVGKYQVDTWRVGVRLHLDGGDLQTITNHGASWRGASGMYENFPRF